MNRPGTAPQRPRTGRLRILLAPLLAVGCAGAPRIDLVLLVTVDTLRADHLGAYGSPLGLTPHLDRLARESLVFHAAYAPTPFTLPSVASLLTGRHPEALGIWSNDAALPGAVPTLAAALQARGWRTGAVVSNFVLRRPSGLDRGFDLYDDALPQREASRPAPERVAIDTTGAALRALDELQTRSRAPRFLWVHYQDPHGPYSPPAGRRERFLVAARRAPDAARLLPVNPDRFGTGGIPRYQFLQGRRDVAFYRAGYAGEVSYADEGIGRLLEALGRRGLRDRTAVAFVADHGEGLGEHDYWFAHGERLEDPHVRVPLLIRVPGRAAGERRDVVSLRDLFPTLLGLATGETVERPGGARDLLAPGAGRQASSPYLTSFGVGRDRRRRLGLVEGDYKFVLEEREAGWVGRLSPRDREEVDLSARHPDIADAMRRRLAARRGGLAQARQAIRQALSPAEREALRALGYAD